MSEEKVFKLFACCLPVKGARRSTICDVQRGSFEFIPNVLYEILTEHEGKTPAQIKQAFDHEYDEYIDEYLAFLVDGEYGFYTDEPQAFPPMDLAWKSPSVITNAIIDADGDSQHDFADIFAQLDALNCKAVQLRFYDSLSYAQLAGILEAAQYSRLASIDLMLKFNAQLGEKDGDEYAYHNLCNKYQRISSVVIHSCPTDRFVYQEDINVPINWISQAIDPALHCGEIHPSHFQVNLSLFTESQAFNSCLNRKIAIDRRGTIKNCPSHATGYGNVRDTRLKQVVDLARFRERWTMRKDQITICRDCEFRYICTDCRVFLQDPQDAFSKPGKCSYDPYTATWANPADDPANYA